MKKRPSGNPGAWRRLALAIPLACTLGMARAGARFHCSFARGAWDPNRWILVKSPRWSHFGGWVQQADCIENETPAGVDPKELLGKRAPETYSSMVLRETFSGNVVVRSTMEFTDRMAPLIVLASALGHDPKGRPEYRTHYEVVLYDGGVNVWHHFYKAGKPAWIKAAYWRFPLRPNKKYRLEVRVQKTRRGKMLVVSVDGREMGYTDNTLPEVFHVGVTGCEGRNRFYDFQVESR